MTDTGGSIQGIQTGSYARQKRSKFCAKASISALIRQSPDSHKSDVTPLKKKQKPSMKRRFVRSYFIAVVNPTKKCM